MNLLRIRTLSGILSMALGLLAASSPAQTLRILPMGDSITNGSSFDSPDGTGGYRGPLYDSLTAAGFTIDYVGTSTANSSQLIEQEHEGHGGWRIDQLDTNVAAWFAAIDTPDFVLLHIGTNDFGQGNDTVNAINRLDALILKMANLSPTTHIIVTNLMERGEPQNTAIQTQFNPFVQGVVDDHIDAGRLVSFLDMRAAVPLADMPDNLHPNQTGYTKMAAAWHSAIEAVLDPGDAVPPSIVSAAGTVSADEVRIAFNKRLGEASAETPANYEIDGGIVVFGAELSPTGRLVTLTTSPQSLGTTYTVSVNNVQDEVTPTPNTIAADSTATFFPVTPSGYFNNIVESQCYSLVYSLDIAASANFGVGDVPYDIDKRDRIGEFDRVAYYMELQTSSGDLQYAWASMDAFTTDIDLIGVPALGTGAVFQQPVANLNVESNVPGVATGEGQDGNLEFWPTNYGAANGEGVPGADGGTFDFGDTRSAGGNYGSMQVHNTSAAQTVIAFNRWGRGGLVDVGIGNNSAGVNADWTFEENAGLFKIKRLQVLVSTTGDHTAPSLASATARFTGTGVSVRFSEPVRPDTLLATNFALDNGVSVLGIRFGEDLSEVLLETTAHPPEVLTLTVSGVRDAAQSANLIVAESTVAVSPASPPAEILANIGAAADGYELLYSIEIPDDGNFNTGNPYTVDNSSGLGAFSRVAYYLELQTAGNPVEYLWTSMDAFTTNPNQLRVPTVDSGAVFQTLVTDLEVLSNKAGIVTGSGIATGNIEFWPSNYGRTNTIAIPGASDAVYDFGDQATSSVAGHGSMQVHNHGAAQTLFALNNFGIDGGALALGIGNRPGADNTDWTFAANAFTYTRKVMHVMVLPTPEPPVPPVPAEVLANVPESNRYELVYSLDVPANGNLSGGAGYTAYDVDTSSRSDSFSRVAYYFELEQTGDPQPTFVWVSMDAFTQNRKLIGVPNLASGALWQQLATNLTVVSNSPNVTAGTGLSGNLEFWPTNYDALNSLPVPGASASVFDFGDRPTPGGYGSMQVHNPIAGETLFAINRWGSAGNTTIPLCVGIGTNPTPVNNATDWTFTDNAPSFDRRRLHVLVQPGASPLGGPQIESVIASTTGDRLVVRFDRELSDPSATAANFSLDGGLGVSSALLLANRREIAVGTSSQTAGVAYTLSVTGVQERASSGAFVAPGSTAAFTAYTPPAVLANIPDAGYELIHALDIPVDHPRWNANSITYSIDESKYGERTFDRVGYLLQLDGDWAYASFDAHTDRIDQVGVPTLGVSPTPFQRIVENMNVASNVAGVVAGNGIATGNIEFWGGNYQAANALNIPGASAASYDYGDLMTGGDYGSMQIHNHGAAQTVLAYNDWAGNVGGMSDVGIGNNTSTGDSDWTFTSNADDFSTRRLYVLVRPGGSPSGAPPTIDSHPCDREVEVGATVAFSVNVSGVGPFAYQWRRNGLELAGQTEAWLELSAASAADTGIYDVVVTGTNLVSATSKPAVLSLIGVPLTAFELWRLANGLGASDGSLDDREGDGVINILEFAFGTDPKSTDSTLSADGSSNGTPAVDFDPGLGVMFVRRDDHGQPGSVTYTVQFSADLETFYDSAEVPALVANSSDDPAYEIVRVPFMTMTPDEKVPNFFRVSVELVP